MLGWVITCHDDRAQELLDALERSEERRVGKECRL